MAAVRKKSKRSQNSQKTIASIYEPPNENDISSHNVFSLQFIQRFDERAKRYGRLIQQQSDRDLPRTFFAQGIIPSDDKKKKNKKKFAAHEQQGVILVILFILVSSLGEYFEVHMSIDRQSSFISLFEKLILLENFFQAESLTQEEVKLMKIYVPLLMDLFKRTIDRKDGMAFKFVKFHLMLHLTDDIIRNGVCQNTSSGPGETRHKSACKKPAKYTQRIAQKFLRQLGEKYTDSLLIERAANEAKVTEVQKKHNDVPKFSAKRFFFERDAFYDLKRKMKHNQYERTTEWFDEDLQCGVEIYLKELFEDGCLAEDAIIDCYTECKIGETLIRANPLYKNERPWHDWVNVKTKDSEIIPIHCILFLHLKGIQEPIEQQNGIETIANDGFYALCHRIPVALDAKPVHKEATNHLAHQGSLLFYYSTKKMILDSDRRRRPMLCLVDISNQFSSACVAVPDLDAKVKHSFIFMKSRCDWQKIFAQHVKYEVMELLSEDDEVDLETNDIKSSENESSNSNNENQDAKSLENIQDENENESSDAENSDLDI